MSQSEEEKPPTIEDLLDEVVQGKMGKEEQWVPPAAKVQLPDAVVLVITVLRCRCGERYEYPNIAPMLQFGTSLTRPKKWLSDYNDVKREIRTVDQTTICCEKCFPETMWTHNDFTRFEKEEENRRNRHGKK